MSEKSRATAKEALNRKTAGFVIDRLVRPGQEGYVPLQSQRPDQQDPMVFFVDPAHPDKKPRTHRLRGEQAQDAFLEMMEDSRTAPSDDDKKTFGRLDNAFKAGLATGNQEGFGRGHEQGTQWATEEIARLTQELTSAQQEADQLRTEVNELTAQVESLKSEVQTLTDQVQHLRAAAAANTQPDPPTPPDDPIDAPADPAIPPVNPGAPADPDAPPAPTDPAAPAGPDVPAGGPVAPNDNLSVPFDQGDEPQPNRGGVRRFFSRFRRRPNAAVVEPVPLVLADDEPVEPVIVTNQPVVPAEVVQPNVVERDRRGRTGAFIGGLAVGAAVAGIAVWDYMEHKHFGHNPSREIRQQFRGGQFAQLRLQEAKDHAAEMKRIATDHREDMKALKNLRALEITDHNHELNAIHGVLRQVHQTNLLEHKEFSGHTGHNHHAEIAKNVQASLSYRGDTVWHEVSRRYKEHVAKITGYVLKINHLKWRGGGPGVDAHDLPVGFRFKIPLNLPANIAHLFKK